MTEINVKISLPREPTDDERELANNELAIELEAIVKQKFDYSNWQKWPERMNPNIAGILQDLRTSGNLKPRRFAGRPIGVDTGVLMNSIFTDVEDGNVKISAIDYAQQFHEGGPRRIAIDENIRENLPKAYRKHKDEFKKHNLGWLFGLVRKESFEFNQEARPLITANEVEKIAEYVYKSVVK